MKAQRMRRQTLPRILAVFLFLPVALWAEDGGQPIKLGPEKKSIGLDYLETPLVEHYRKEFLSNFGVKWITSALDSGSLYRAYAQKKIAQMGIPACLEFLPLIESAYKHDARSKSGAVGLWQFAENSAAPFLQKNGWVDERLDPWKSTDAALAKLAGNYRQFGDWLLAIAAYNTGAGAISRALKQSNEKNFWALADAKLLKDETAHYVPKFLAICDIIINAEYFGLSFPLVTAADELEMFFYKSKAPVVISGLCRALEMDETLFFYLNPSLLLGISPPDFTFRLPLYYSEAASFAFTAAAAPGAIIHTVAKGDTLWGISRRYGVSIAELCRANGIDEKAILPIGKTLLLPIHK
jgi:membrane-bound lytic murein transglycosylase D